MDYMIDLDVKDRFKLSSEFKDSLHAQKEKFGFGLLGATVYYRTYSRIMEDGRQERFADTVIRVVEGLFTIRKWHYLRNHLHWDEEYWNAKAEEMAQAIFDIKLLGSGRGLWAMGSETVYRIGAAALNNPLSGDTLVTTENGIVPIESLEGRTTRLLTHEGFKDATVKCYGEQKVQEIVFAPMYKAATWRKRINGKRRRVVATMDHGWPVEGISEKEHNLKVGQIVKGVSYSPNTSSADYKYGFVHGVVFGDGTKGHDHTDTDTSKYQLRLCGEKAQLAEMFIGMGFNQSEIDGDPYLTKRSAVRYKEVPTQGTNADYIAGFIEGWMSTDGTKRSGSSFDVASTDLEALDWLEDNAQYAGYIVHNRRTEKRTATNYSQNPKRMDVVSLSTGIVGWEVESITPIQTAIPVYCATVPEAGYFALAGGIYTGNCGSVDVKVLSEDAAWTMDFLMLGVGTGHNTTFFENPTYFIPEENAETEIYVIPDSREGWVESLRRLIASYETEGSPRVEFDYSKIRRAGEPIRGFGGTASGPDPLIKLHERVRGYLDSYALGKTSGTRMIVDTMNAIGACVVAGNVRRSAEISVGDPNDEEFINLKNYELNPERAEIGWMSNNSVIMKEHSDFTTLPSIAQRVRDNGEPGIINLLNIQKYGRYGEKTPDNATGTNPCAEIALESYELCNLAEVFPTRCVNENGEFDEDEFIRVVKLAALYTATVSLLPTHDERTNAVVARNRRTGVSLSGIADWLADHPATNVITWLDKGYKAVREENNRLNEEAGVPPAVRVTTVKPSGTVSLLAGVSSGMHLPPFSRYIRRVRVGENTPIVPILKEANVPHEKDVYSDNTLVFEFPVDQGKVKGQKDVSVWAKAQTVVMLQRWWADNMVSNTLSFDPEREGDQIEDLLTYTVPNIKSISLLPLLDEGSVYAQSPIEQITLEEVNRRKKEIKEIDWDKFSGSDGEDSKFCTSDGCEWTPEEN